MEEKKIKRLLSGINIPEPEKEARDRAIRSALSEFRKQREKKSKGFSWVSRLKDKNKKGGLFMNKPITITAGLVAGFMALMITFSTLFLNNKSDLSEPFSVSSVEKSINGDKFVRNNLIEKKPPVDAPTVAEGKEKQPLKPAQQKKVVAKSPRPGFVSISAFNPSESDGLNRQAPDNQEYIGRDKFENISPNPIKLVTEEPVSTFSIDVDTTSYSFVRRAINSGYLPRKDAVRVEEMINYFDYEYPLPEDKSKPFKPLVALFPTPWNPETKLLHIGIKGYDIEPETKPRSNLVFLIDVSGSMNSPDKLPLLKNSLRMLVDTLDPDDTVSMVVYAGAAGTVLEKTEIRDKGKVLAALDRLEAGGSTAGGEGIRLAYSLAETNMEPGTLNRVILATDGDFNVGIRDPEVLKNFVERKRDKNIYLSVLGFGQGNYNDDLMQKLAQNGNGNAAYIDTLNEARKVLVDEVKGTLFTIAKDVKIQIEFNPSKVAEYRLIGYETRMLKREDFNNDRVDAGDIGSGHTVTALYEITPVKSSARLIDDLRYSAEKDSPVTDKKSSEYAFLKIRYKLPDEKESILITTAINKNNEYPTILKTPAESRFAAAVAAFGQLLRGDSHIGQFDYNDVINLARKSKGEDLYGYRTEFINLVRLAKSSRAMGER